MLWGISGLPRVRKCGRVTIGGRDVPLDVKVSAERVAHVAGTMRCGSIWACPVCSAKIRNERAKTIAAAAGQWQASGNAVYMVTFTAPHDLGMRLAPLLKLIAGTFSRVIAGRAWAGTPARTVPERPSKRGGTLPARFYPAVPGVRELAGVVGTVRSLEITYGPNGWHPHLHVLVFCEGDPGAEGLTAMTLHFQGKWAAQIEKEGYRVPSAVHGVKVERCTSAAEAGLYISKTQDGRSVGNELARGDMKRGKGVHRTPLQILNDFGETGDRDDLDVWLEYETATKGHQAITWSKGLKELLGVDERTDEEIAESQEDGETVLQITAGAWRRICRVPGLDVAILEAVETGGVDAVVALLAPHGIRPGDGLIIAGQRDE